MASVSAVCYGPAELSAIFSLATRLERIATPMTLFAKPVPVRKTAAGPTSRQLPAAYALVALTATMLAGCQLWPFAEKDRTTIVTPAMRVSAIQDSVARARDAGPERQQQLCRELAEQIRIEPDPIVRETIQEAMGQFNTPLASAVLEAGLDDDNFAVQLACCRILGERGDPAAVGGLSRLVQSDASNEVRLAAVDALGQINSSQSVPAIAEALRDVDPAMQFAGVKAMQSATDQEIGNDVQAWLDYANSLSPNAGEEAIAERPGETSSY